MTGVLGDVVVTIVALECLLVAFLVVLRVLLRRNRRRADTLPTAAELAIASYLATDTPVEPAIQPVERAIWRDVALEALSDLRGSEQAQLAGLLDDLGYVTDATSELRARRRATRRRGAETLAAIANPVSVPALSVGLRDRDVGVRTTCARALAEIGGAENLPDVITALTGDVRAAPGAVGDVVLALGRNHGDALGSLLSPDAPAEVRSIAVSVVSELRLTQHAPLLRARLIPDSDEAAAAARGLGRIGDVQAVPALIDLAGDDSRDPEARAAAAAALGSIGDASAVGSIEPLAQDEDWSLRAAATLALARLGDQGRGALRQAAMSASEQVRVQAEAALQQ